MQPSDDYGSFKKLIVELTELLRKDVTEETIDTATSLLKKYFECNRLMTYRYLHRYYMGDPILAFKPELQKTKVLNSLTGLYTLIDKCVVHIQKEDAEYSEPVTRIVKFLEYFISVQNSYRSGETAAQFMEEIGDSYQKAFTRADNAMDKAIENANSAYDNANSASENANSAVNIANQLISDIKDIQKDLNKFKGDIWTQIIAIMSIVSSVIIALITSQGIITGIATNFQHIQSSSIDGQAFIILLAVILCFNMVYFSLAFIRSLILHNDYMTLEKKSISNSLSKDSSKPETSKPPKTFFLGGFIFVNLVLVAMLVFLCYRIYILSP